MHNRQKNFCNLVKEFFPQFFEGKWVIDCGSLDINGNNQYLFENCFYLGVDVIPGKNVHVISPIHELSFVDGLFDVVLSTNAFEHDMYWQESLPKMCRLLKSGGLMFFSCSRNHPEHGTTHSIPEFSGTSEIEGWSDYYKNLDIEDIKSVINVDEIFQKHEFRIPRNGLDLYFYGIKQGDIDERV